jgi:MFS family permease
VLCAHTLLFQAVTFLLRPTASYRAIELDVSSAWLGVLAASFALAPLAVALPAGDAADRYGERRVLVLGATVVCVSALLYLLLSGSFAGLLVATVVLGAGHLLCTVAQQAMVANLIPVRRIDSAYGYYTFFGALGQAAGPGLLALFGATGSLPDSGAAFLAGLGLASAMVAVTFLARPTPRRAEAVPTAQRAVSSLMKTPGLTKALVVSSVVLSSMDITLVYLPALGAEQGLAVGLVGALLMVRAIASMGSRLLLGRLSELLGRRIFLVSSIAVSAVATGIVPFPVPVAALVVAMVVMGFGFGVCQPLTLSWLAEIAPPGLRGRVMSLRLVVNRFGQVVIPAGIGLVASGLGAAGVLWLTAAALAGASVTARSVPMDAGGSA